MTNTTQEFKVGDKVKYKDDQCASINDHVQSKVYTVEKVEEWFGPESGQRVWFEDSPFVCWSGRLELSNQHIHHDLICAWAKDPKGCIIQWRNPSGDWSWSDCNTNKPGWDNKLEYRIKPRTKEVTRWKWVFKVQDGYEVTNSYYTEDEAKKRFDKPLHKIEDSKVTAIEEV